jgi:glycosyltransferase involved in cell wall biosynthesis
LTIALDATYSVGEHLSGVGVYSREILGGLAEAHADVRFLWCYRPHRILRSWRQRLPGNCRRRLLGDRHVPRGAGVFHGLNQRLPQVPFRRAVSTFHDLFVLTGEYSTAEFRRRFASQAREAAERSDLIIAVSEYTARQVETLLGVERSRLRVVHHGVRRPGSILPQAERERMVLHVGALQRRKNVARLVEAFESVEEGWRLVLAGSSGFGAEEIFRRIERSPRREHIFVLGYVSAERLRQLYARAAVLAFPSLDEGFGMPVLEAMVAGTAVLASDCSALPEVSGNAALLVDPEEVDAIADALQRLTRDENLREKLAADGLHRAKTFTWEAAVARTWSVYQELSGQSGTQVVVNRDL